MSVAGDRWEESGRRGTRRQRTSGKSSRKHDQLGWRSFLTHMILMRAVARLARPLTAPYRQGMRWWMAPRHDARIASSWLAMVVLSGCGGRAVTERDGRESTEPTTRTSSGAPKRDAGLEGHELDSTLELGDCHAGWQPDEAPCPWLASDGLCYATKEDACACICPSQGNTVCASGLPGGEDDRVRVSCR